MYYKIEDFLSDWAYEQECMVKYLNNLEDKSLTYKTNEKVREIKQLVWHITATIPEMMHKIGLPVLEVDYELPAPNQVKILKETYQNVCESLVKELKNWNDEKLLISDEMYGEIWTKGATLKYMLFHQIHHRGQLSVLMREANLQVPGVYGPSKEEWEAMNIPAMI